jgi:hypothetical protein
MKTKTAFSQINDLKKRLHCEFGFRFAGTLNERALLWAINEADAVAATTEYPLLVFPSLAEEKVSKARSWQEKQQEIVRRPLLLAA